MAIQELKARIARLPEQPGVYLFSDRTGGTLYVGKARVLRARVRSYLGARGASPKTDALLDEIADLEVIVTDSVVEALALESHLIKQRTPRYNILLRDDKNYPWLQLTTGEAFPRILVARRVERDGHIYAGPFLPASLARRILSLTHRLFGIRSCNEVITGGRDRPCLEYDIGRCVAPCVESICTPGEYGRAVESARLFLEGRNEDLLADLRRRMTDAAAAERFEQAAQLRDAIRTIETLRDRQQKVADARLGDRDAFGLRAGPSGAVIQVFQMRGGRVIERVTLTADAGEAAGAPAADMLEAALQQFYEARPAPPEVHVPEPLENADLLEAWLSQRVGRRVRILVPRRGDKRGLLDLAARNAALAYDEAFNAGTAAHYEALERLQGLLQLPVRPRRIDAFDISTIQGRETVASMVVCEDGRLKRSEYRKYRIKGSGLGTGPSTSLRPAGQGLGAGDAGRAPGPDDFAAMREVVLRRYQRVMAEGGPFPDLVLVDGGRGQVSVATEALEALGLGRLMVVGLAKQEEHVFRAGRPEPLVLASSDPALRLLMRLRDEAHRVAVMFHRRARTLRDLRSALDEVPGVGPRRRRALLTRFGSVAGVRRATREELIATVGRKPADALLEYFRGSP